MKEIPILYSAPMVRSILDDTKHNTRRVAHFFTGSDAEMAMQFEPRFENGVWKAAHAGFECDCQYGKPGDRLWVRETWRAEKNYDTSKPSELSKTIPIWYEADGAHGDLVSPDGNDHKGRIRQSIFMPRWMSRITLEVQSISAERLQDITEEGAKAEGVQKEDECEETLTTEDHESGYTTPQNYTVAFQRLWDSLNKKRGYGWDVNPWVWSITFKKL